MNRSVLLVDDDIEILDALRRFFQRRHWRALTAPTGEEGIARYTEAHPELVVLDLQLPSLSGLDALRVLRARDPEAAVILLTAHGDIATAVEAMRLGAENFLTKPVELAHLEAAAERAYEKVELRRANRAFAHRLASRDEVEALGSSPIMRQVARQVERLAAADDTTVLIFGESGTGKGWLARLIHDRSSRASRPFMDVNCAGLTATFVENELFGHEKGAFTDAKEQKPGLLEVANGGSVFLDEIGDLASETQPKLLKVLEERRFRRLGGTREISVDVRLIAATHRDLAREVEAGRFREDLYYRLNVLPIRLPALRERARQDLLELASALFATLCHRMGAHNPELTPEALKLLLDYPWPGNVRELRNVLERALILAGGPAARRVGPEHLPPELRGATQNHTPDPAYTPMTLQEMERRLIARTLLQHGGNRTRAAADLAISRVTLYNKIRRYGLESIGR